MVNLPHWSTAEFRQSCKAISSAIDDKCAFFGERLRMIVGAMKTERFVIDDMVDAHVWMRRQDACLRRVLTLDNVPDDLLTEYERWRGAADAASYLCTDPLAALVPIAEITTPVRKLNTDVLRSLLRGIRDGG